MHRLTIVLVLLAVALIPAATAGSAGQLGYIVVLKDGSNSTAVAADHAARYGLDVGFVYRNALRGYSAVVPGASLDALRADARVAYVERDSTVHASTTQTGVTWGIDRTDQRALPLSTTYTYTATGSGVTAALYLQVTPGATPQQVRDGLYALTTKNVVTDARSANAHLLFSNL